MTFHPILREKTKRNVELTVQGILVEILREEVWTNHLYLSLWLFTSNTYPPLPMMGMICTFCKKLSPFLLFPTTFPSHGCKQIEYNIVLLLRSKICKQTPCHAQFINDPQIQQSSKKHFLFTLSHHKH